MTYEEYKNRVIESLRKWKAYASMTEKEMADYIAEYEDVIKAEYNDNTRRLKDKTQADMLAATTAYNIA